MESFFNEEFGKLLQQNTKVVKYVEEQKYPKGNNQFLLQTYMV